MAVFNGKFGDGKTVSNVVTFWNGPWVVDSEIGAGASIGDGAILRFCNLAERTEVGRRNTLDHVKMDIGTYTGEFTIIKYATVGKFCAISWNVSIGGANHDVARLALTPSHRILGEKTQEAYSSFKEQSCTIGNDVWLAAGVHVLRNVHVGDGAVIGANSVVTKDIPPYAIAVGSPAKVVGRRFPDELATKLLKIKWWNFPLDVLRGRCRAILDRDLTAEDVVELERIKADLS